MSTKITAKLICPECRRENEAERIYCHSCGSRLDRSALAKVKPKEEDPKATQKRLKAMFDARRARARLLFFATAKLVLGALAVAALVQMLRPADMPAPKTEAGNFPPQVSLELENAAIDPRAGAVRYSEEQLNTYFTAAFKSKQGVLSKYLKFDRLAVGFNEGLCRAVVQRSYSGFPVSTTVLFVPEVKNGAVTAKCLGGAIGRLPVHPQLMQYADFLFADVRSVLERERKSVAKLGTVELHPQTLIVSRRAPQT